jgi:hypothetical protein
MAFARTLVEEADASDALDDLRKDYKRFEELWMGWSWRLARDPLADAYRIPEVEPPTYLIKSGDLSHYDMPSAVTILYRFTDEDVTILAVRGPVPDADEKATPDIRAA